MRQECTENIIKDFCNAIKSDFDNNFKVEYEYDKENDFWSIWHSYRDFDDINFRRKIGKNIIKYFFNNNLTNTSFAYNSDLDEKTNIINDKSSIPGLEIEYIDPEITEINIKIHKNIEKYIVSQDNFNIACDEQETIHSLNKNIVFCLPDGAYTNYDLFKNKTSVAKEEVPAA